MATIRVTIGVLSVLFILFSSVITLAGEVKVNTICQLCGMDAAKSETEFILYRKTEPEMHACCINCARRIMNKLGDDITRVTTLDYRTRKHVPAMDAFYVLGSKRVPKGSMTPYVFAFLSEKDATEFKDRHGGTIFSFHDILKQLETEKKTE
jgi:nitrous oxide reductase accessory protein NosL